MDAQSDQRCVPAFKRNWLLYVVKPLAVPFLWIIILLLVAKSHTRTRHRVTLNGTALWAIWFSVWNGNPFSASWSYAPKGPGLNWCLAASGNPPPSWLKCCRIGLTFMLLRFDRPPVRQVECYPLWLEPILAADSRRLRLQQVIRCHSSSKKPSFSPSSIFCAELQDKKHNRGQGWTQTIYCNRYEEDTLWNSPNGTDTWYTLHVRGMDWRRGGFESLLYILSYSVHQASLYSPHVSVNQVILPWNSMM